MVLSYKKFFCFLCLIIVLLVTGCSSVNNDKAVKDNKIETEWYTLVVPDDWMGLYAYEECKDERGDRFTLNVSMKSKSDSQNALLFYIEMSPLSDAEYVAKSLEWDTPIGVITTDKGKSYYVSAYSTKRIACEKGEEDKFKKLLNGVDKCLSTFKPKHNNQFQKWNDKFSEEIKAKLDQTPYVPYAFNLIGRSFESYKNQTGGYFYDMANPAVFKSLSMNQLEGVSYFYSRHNGLNELVAVENGRISAYAYTTDRRIVVRDVVNQMMMTELFDIAPEARVLDSRGVSFYSWRGTNAYMGIKVVGGLTPKHIYSNQVIHVIVYSDKKFCSVMN